METIFDKYSRDEIEDVIEGIMLMIDDKFKDKEILEKIDRDFGAEFLNIAKARIKAEEENEKTVGEEVVYFGLDDLRFATSYDVAEYRARRLRCKKIVDLCSGIGVQARAFSETCEEVLSIEIDARKVRYIQENFKDVKNLKLFCGDVLSNEVIEKIREFGPDVIFCDPERLASEGERNLGSIKPDLKKLVEAYSKICPNICIEIPPQIEQEKLKELGNAEYEYLSLDKKLNRLNIYLGKLKKSDVSAVDVISGVEIVSDGKIKQKGFSKKVFKYLYEVSPAILKAGLSNEIADSIGAEVLEYCEKGKLLMSSNKLYSGKFSVFLNAYYFLDEARRIEEIADVLRVRNFGKAVLKYSVNPKDYWKERNKIENRLSGKKEAVVFALDDKGKKKYLVCEKI